MISSRSSILFCFHYPSLFLFLSRSVCLSQTQFIEYNNLSPANTSTSLSLSLASEPLQYPYLLSLSSLSLPPSQRPIANFPSPSLSPLPKGLSQISFLPLSPPFLKAYRKFPFSLSLPLPKGLSQISFLPLSPPCPKA